MVPLLSVLISLTLSAQNISNLAEIRTLHVGQIWSNNRAEGFRSMLVKELSSRGFLVTESENADATLSGALVITSAQTPSSGGTTGMAGITEMEARTYAQCEAILKSRDGTVLWKWDEHAGDKRFWEKETQEPIGNLAFKLASALDKDYKKALKKKDKERKN
jgi:hypothetical protein